MIPLLDSLTFFSKKGMGYEDWRSAAMLKLRNKRLTPEGKDLIDFLCSRMNKNRLTTNTGTLNSLNPQQENLMDLMDLMGLMDLMDLMDLRIKEMITGERSGVWVYDKGVLVKGSPLFRYNSSL